MLAVGVIAPTLDRRAVHRTGAAAGENIAGGKRVAVSAQIFLYIRRRGDDLERRAGLVNIADDSVSRKRV